MKIFKITFIFLMCLFLAACISETRDNRPLGGLKVGAERFDAYLPLLEGKSVAVIANMTSVAGGKHLVDVLLEENILVRKVFAPEHGFRGEKDAGETVNDEVDVKTGLPIFSLYGSQKKPAPELLSDVDVMVFDIQDVGVRFYTYLSTLHYVMEACAENSIPLILLDRPNPNGASIDGPVLESDFTSFVGLHAVPLIYGMTIGEYGQMINGEGWLKGGVECNLKVIKLTGYSHDTIYTLPVKPSPNLPNMTSIYLYPSLALFEGTVVSIGRGTAFPFQVIGHPDYAQGDFTFTPRPTAGAMTPKLDGQLSRGVDLRRTQSSPLETGLSLDWIIDFYEALPNKENFFLKNNFFNKLAGNDTLMAQIKAGTSATEIKATWEAELTAFRETREKYLLYK